MRFRRRIPLSASASCLARPDETVHDPGRCLEWVAQPVYIREAQLPTVQGERIPMREELGSPGEATGQ